MRSNAILNPSINKDVVSPSEPLAEYGELLSVGEVCEILRLTGRVVRSYLASGKLPGVKVGSRWVVPKKKLIEYLFS